MALITNALVKHSTKIFVTFNSPVNGTWWVSEKAEGSFRVSLSAPQTADVSFDYFLIQTENQSSSSPSTEPQSATQSGDPNDAAASVVTEGSNAVTPPVIADGSPNENENTASSTPEMLISNDLVENASTTPVLSADTTPPVVVLVGEAALQINQGDAFSDPGATASDETDGDITANIITTGAVDTSKGGLYTLTYAATDASGNTGSVSRVVTVFVPVVSTTTPTESLSL